MNSMSQVTIQEHCDRCQGSGIEPDGWTLESARENPHEYSKHRIEREHGPNSRIMDLMPHIVSPLYFNEDGNENCTLCKGTGKSLEWRHLEAERMHAERAKQAEAEKAECLKQYKTLQRLTGDVSQWALGAKNIRTELKATFPGVRFQVQSQSYSGGCSIRVGWTDGPTQKQVEEVTRKYQEGYFDGMTDCYEYTNRTFPGLFGGARYVFEERTISDEQMEIVKAEYLETHSERGLDKWDLEREISIEARQRSCYVAPEKPKRSASTAGQCVDHIKIERNKKRNGIEITFPGKPSDEIRQALRDNGFRFSRFQGIWWAKHTDERLVFAQSLQEGQASAKPAHTTPNEKRS